MKGTTAFIAIAVALAVCAAAISVILSGGSESSSGQLATPWQPRFAKGPGGFDSMPEFDSTSGELEFRGATCWRPREDPYVLYRECASNTEH
jgi:hypothetical protein